MQRFVNTFRVSLHITTPIQLASVLFGLVRIFRSQTSLCMRNACYIPLCACACGPPSIHMMSCTRKSANEKQTVLFICLLFCFSFCHSLGWLYYFHVDVCWLLCLLIFFSLLYLVHFIFCFCLAFILFGSVFWYLAQLSGGGVKKAWQKASSLFYWVNCRFMNWDHWKALHCDWILGKMFDRVLGSSIGISRNYSFIIDKIGYFFGGRAEKLHWILSSVKSGCPKIGGIFPHLIGLSRKATT